MKKLKSLFLIAVWAACFNFMPAYAEAIPHLPVNESVEGVEVDLSSFELPTGDFTLEVQCNANAYISICGVYEYTATEAGSVRFARKAGKVIVYEGNTYKATLVSTGTPYAGIENVASATYLDGTAYGRQVTLGPDDHWDMTLYVVNPEFDNATIVNKAPTGWIQTTNAGTSKISVVAKGDGSVIVGDQNHWQIYSGGAVKGKAYQVINNLPSGKYKFTAGLYAYITGPVYLYANTNKIEVTNDSSAYYTVDGIVVDGTLEIGMEIATTGGTTLEFDHVTLEYYGPDMESVITAFGDLITTVKETADSHMNAAVKTTLNSAISSAEAILQNPTEEAIGQASTALRSANEAAKTSIAQYVTFKTAIDTAEVHVANYTGFPGYAAYLQVVNTTKSAYDAAQIEGDAITALITAMQTAEVTCLLTQEAPYDATFVIVNPSFENSDSYKGWVNNGMQTQSNASFALKVGSRYLEKWVADGNNLPNVSMTQTIHNLPNGAYELTIVGFCTQAGMAADGGYLFGNSAKTALGDAGEYTLEAIVMDNTLTFGIMTENATANWIAADDFHLRFVGYNLSVAVAALRVMISDAQNLYASGNPMSETLLEVLNTAINGATSACISPTDEGMKAASSTLSAAMDDVKTSIQQYLTLQNELDRLSDLCENGADLYPDGHADFVDTYFDIAILFGEGAYDSEGIIAAIGQLKDAESACYLSGEPPLDATFAIHNPGFENGSYNNGTYTTPNGWMLNATMPAGADVQLKNTQASEGTYRFYLWCEGTENSIDLYQDIVLTKGEYTLKADVKAQVPASTYIYAGIGAGATKSEVPAESSWTAWASAEVTFIVPANGTTRIGLSAAAMFMLDNFQLMKISNYTDMDSPSIDDLFVAEIYPNPTDGLFTLNFAATDTYRITVANLSGNVLSSQTAHAQTIQMDLSIYPSGAYLLTVDNGVQQKTIKVMKK